MSFGRNGETIRAFIAIELAAETKRLLGEAQEELRGSLGRAAGAVAWTRPEAMHLTLQFLGETPVSVLGGIGEGIRRACEQATPFSLRVGGLGAFPNARRPRVVWVGVEGDEGAMRALHALQGAVTSEMGPLGFKPDKSFNPHLTLGRVRERAGRDEVAAIGQALERRDAQPPPDSFGVRGVSLIRSELLPGDSRYTQLAHVELGGVR